MINAREIVSMLLFGAVFALSALPLVGILVGAFYVGTWSAYALVVIWVPCYLYLLREFLGSTEKEPEIDEKIIFNPLEKEDLELDLPDMKVEEGAPTFDALFENEDIRACFEALKPIHTFHVDWIVQHGMQEDILSHITLLLNKEEGPMQVIALDNDMHMMQRHIYGRFFKYRAVQARVLAIMNCGESDNDKFSHLVNLSRLKSPEFSKFVDDEQIRVEDQEALEKAFIAFYFGEVDRQLLFKTMYDALKDNDKARICYVSHGVFPEVLLLINRALYLQNGGLEQDWEQIAKRIISTTGTVNNGSRQEPLNSQDEVVSKFYNMMGLVDVLIQKGVPLEDIKSMQLTYSDDDYGVIKATSALLAHYYGVESLSLSRVDNQAAADLPPVDRPSRPRSASI